MGQESQKATTSEVVRIWKEAKGQVLEIQEAVEKKERRPVSEAEIVSKAVKAYHKIQKRKLSFA